MPATDDERSGPIDILLVGADGLLGRRLRKADWPEHVRLYSRSRRQLDITDPGAISREMRLRPYSAIINAAAFTSVDGAEARAQQAWAVNAGGAANLARAAEAADALMVQISTDCVFGSTAGPHDEAEVPQPESVYGRSKREGESQVMASSSRALVVRTAWLFDAEPASFVTRLLSNSADAEVRMVDERLGAPTAARDLAAALIWLIMTRLGSPGGQTIMHFTNSGQATRYQLARDVFGLWEEAGGVSPGLSRAAEADFPSSAPRPADSRLGLNRWIAETGEAPRHWRAALKDVVWDWMAQTRAASVRDI